VYACVFLFLCVITPRSTVLSILIRFDQQIQPTHARPKHALHAPSLEFSAMRPGNPTHAKISRSKKLWGKKNDTADRLSNLRKFPGGRNTVRSLRYKQRIPLCTYREAPARRTQCLTLCRRQRRFKSREKCQPAIAEKRALNSGNGGPTR